MSRDADKRLGFWLSTANAAAADIAQQLGYRGVVLDIEHGAFDMDTLYHFIPLLHHLGLTVYAKVLAPERGPIQQVLDFGADVVVIPHIDGLEHARHVTSFAKFAPTGERSYAGGRVSDYGSVDDEWLRRQNSETRCFPMIESSGALAEIDAILALPTVDGLFVGPSDLSLSRRGVAYRHSSEDLADIIRIAEASARAGKSWVLPAWSHDEKWLALEHGAECIVATMEFSALKVGLSLAIDEVRQIWSECHPSAVSTPSSIDRLRPELQ